MSISNVARKQSKEKEKAGQRHAVYDLLAITAAFKANSQRFKAGEDAPYYAAEDYRYGNGEWLINGQDATMSYCEKWARCGIIVGILASTSSSTIDSLILLGMEIL